MIEIIEHRGGWCKGIKKYDEQKLQNSYKAFCNSFERKNGIETDIRDMEGDIVISHDIPSGKEVRLEKILSLLVENYNSLETLALNIKSDGIQKKLKETLEKYDIDRYFVFDILIPEVFMFKKYGLNYYLRHSEYEPSPKKRGCLLYKHAKGVWLDQLIEPKGGTEQISWISRDVIQSHLNEGKKVAIASPELHLWGRMHPYKLYKLIWNHYKEVFKNLRSCGYKLNNIAICTDLPKEARIFFWALHDNE